MLLEANEMRLWVEFHTMGVFHQVPHLNHHLEHVGRAAALVGLDEVGVFLRHGSRADTKPLSTRRVNQAAGAIALGIREDRPGVLTARLVVATPLHDLGHLRLALALIARRQREPTSDHQLIRPKR